MPILVKVVMLTCFKLLQVFSDVVLDCELDLGPLLHPYLDGLFLIVEEEELVVQLVGLASLVVKRRRV